MIFWDMPFGVYELPIGLSSRLRHERISNYISWLYFSFFYYSDVKTDNSSEELQEVNLQFIKIDIVKKSMGRERRLEASGGVVRWLYLYLIFTRLRRRFSPCRLGRRLHATHRTYVQFSLKSGGQSTIPQSDDRLCVVEWPRRQTADGIMTPALPHDDARCIFNDYPRSRRAFPQDFPWTPK